MAAQYGFYFDNSRCTGCKTCLLACKDYHDLGSGVSYRKVLDFEGGGWSEDPQGGWIQDCFVYHVSLSCCHCLMPACTHVCPTGAMGKDESGIVSVNTNRCIGCGYCTLACPYHAPHIDPVIRKSSKCDACKSRVMLGRKPICVEACPLRALEFGLLADLKEKYGDLSAIAPLPDPSYTLPSVVIKPSLAALSPKSAEGFVANELEVDRWRASSIPG